MARCAADRRAFSLVEVVIVVLIGLNVSLIFYQALVADQRRFFRDQGKLSSLQGAQYFIERIESDLRELVTRVPENSEDRDFTVDNPVMLGKDEDEVTFLRARPEPLPDGGVRTERITYRFDAPRRRALRITDAGQEVLRGLVVFPLRFKLRTVALEPAALARPGAPEPRLFRPKVATFCLAYEFNVLPDDAIARQMDRIPPDQQLTLVGAVALTHRAHRTNHPYWSPNASELIARP